MEMEFGLNKMEVLFLIGALILSIPLVVLLNYARKEIMKDLVPSKSKDDHP